jgi:hypothetical protein
MWTCGETSGGAEGEFAGAAVAIAVHAIEGGQSAIVRALGLGTQAQVGAEPGLLFLGEGLGDSGLAAVVVAADVFPKIAVDAAGALEFPAGVGELLDEDALVGVGG